MAFASHPIEMLLDESGSKEFLVEEKPVTTLLMNEPPNSKIDPEPNLEIEMIGTDAFNRNQLSCWQTSSGVRASAAGPVPVRWPRVLQVLIVDSYPATAELLARLVTHWGHASSAVQDSLTAMRLAATTPPDVVLLDIEIPVTNRYQLARCLRRDLASQDCLIVAITGRADHQRRRQCIEAGIDLVLLKPVDSVVVETLLLLECTRVNRLQADMEYSPWLETRI